MKKLSFKRSITRIISGDLRGATFVEFALVFPLIFLLILGVIDISRYWANRLLLKASTVAAARLATQTTGINIDIRAPSGMTDDPNVVCGDEAQRQNWLDYCERRDRFFSARRDVIEEATLLPSLAFVKPWNRDGATRFIGYLLTDEPDLAEREVSALMLRPGDEFPEINPDGSQICQSSGGVTSCISRTYERYPILRPSDNMEELLREFPILVVGEIEHHWILPFLPTTRIKARGIAYAERLWSKALPDVFNPSAPEIPTFTAVPYYSPTIPPTIAPTATNTPLITNTPRSTRTSTNCESPFCEDPQSYAACNGCGEFNDCYDGDGCTERVQRCHNFCMIAHSYEYDGLNLPEHGYRRECELCYDRVLGYPPNRRGICGPCPENTPTPPPATYTPLPGS